MAFEASRYHDFSAGHRVYGHESKCAHLHGHNYRVYFYVAADALTPDLDDIGRVIDFSVIKERLCEWLEENWDHKMLLWSGDPLAGGEGKSGIRSWDPDGIVVVPFNPTAENMAQHLVEVVAVVQLRGTGVRLVRCTVEETRKCSATYYGDR